MGQWGNGAMHSIDGWLVALERRHRGGLTSAEFLKAIRALSVRYVERRTTLAARSPLDSAGKRAAFAAFYAPLHFFTTTAIVKHLMLARSSGTAATSSAPSRLFDLGCGTGVVSAAWALALPVRPEIVGLDVYPWALTEARWNWQQLGARGRVRREDMLRACERLQRPSRERLDDAAVVAGWSVNEISNMDRERLLPILLELADRGAAVLVIEPLAGAAAPWWPQWEAAFTAASGQSNVWHFEVALPPALQALDEAAGFRRDALTARTLWHHRRRP